MPVDLITPVTPTDPGAPTAPDPPAPHRLDELIAELALAEKWPTPDDYCARCGFRQCTGDSASLCADRAQPMTLDEWLRRSRVDALRAVLGDDALVHPFRHQLARLLGEHMADVYRH